MSLSTLETALATSAAVTPYRQTRIEFDGPQWVLRQGSWSLHREARQMAREPVELVDGSRTENVLLLAGCGWILAPILLSQEGQLSESGVATMLAGDENANLAPNLRTEYRYRRKDLPGVDYDPSVPEVALPCYVKEVASGDDYGRNDLQADRLAYPGPATTSKVPFDRVLSGVKTYRAGQGFLFSFWVPTVGEAADALYRFYFGGPSDITARHVGTGEWCVTFYGDGHAELHERVFGWTRRHVFQWGGGTAARGGWAHCYVEPFDRSRIFFICSAGKGATNALRRLGEERVAPRDYALNTSVYYHSPLLAKYVYKQSITGAGPVRVDARGDLACRFAVGASEYQIVGTVLDAPFELPYVVPAESVLRVRVQKIVPEGADLAYGVYDADTGDLLTPGPNPDEWLTVSGQKRYQLKFTLQGDTTTPYLRSCSVELDPLVTEAQEDEAAVVSVEVGPVASAGLNLLGPDQDVTHQSGEFVLHDLAGECTPLETRGRVPIRIYTQYAQDGSETCLFEGEVNAEQERIYLADGRNYSRYACSLNGRWAQVWEQRVIDTHRFGLKDDDTPERVTTCIRQLLTAAGVPEEQLDIPDLPLEYWLARDGRNDPYLLQHGVILLDVAQRLALEYLDAWLTWCPNSGTSGLWRLRLNPANPGSNILWNFVTAPPDVIGLNGLPVPALPHVPGTYPLQTSFARRIRTKRQAPEATAIEVVGATLGPTGRPIKAFKHNPKGYNLDPLNPTADRSHPDYLGRQVVESFFDPSIQTKAHAQFLCARFFDLLCHGRVLKIIDAPFFPVIDTQDPRYRVPRPLQIGDEITVDGAVAVVRTCNIAYASDTAQMQCVEAVLVPEDE